MADREKDLSAAARDLGIAATLRRMFAKAEPAEDHEYDTHMAGRLADIAARLHAHRAPRCPECGFGSMRAIDDAPTRRAILGSGAFQKPSPAPGSLQCDQCGHLIWKRH